MIPTDPDLPIVNDLQPRARMDEAVQAVQRGLSIRAASRSFEVKPSSLHRRIHGGQSAAAAARKRQKLHQPEEEVLRDYVLEQASKGSPLRPGKVRELGEAILQKSFPDEQLGKNWIYGFLHRYPELKDKLHKNRKPSVQQSVRKDAQSVVPRSAMMAMLAIREREETQIGKGPNPHTIRRP